MCSLDLAEVEKEELIPDSATPRSDFLLLSNYYLTLSKEVGDRTVEAGKIGRSMGFVTRFLNGASQEIKVKLKESRLLKFYQVKQLKENSKENSAEKNLKEDSQFNEL